MRRIDSYLTRKAQAQWPRSLVVEAEDGVWLLIRVVPGEGDFVESTIIADDKVPHDRKFRTAKESILQLIAHEAAL